MSVPEGNNDKIGYGRPPKAMRWKKGQSGNPKGKYSPRDNSVVATIDRLLLTRVDLNISGDARKVSTLEAIILQLWIKEISGDRRALRTRLRYEQFVNRNIMPRAETIFAEDEYSRALANSIKVPEKDHG
jgi:hypothetical protein